MTFDYFNPSNLAFGAKITTVFTQLSNLADSAEENLEQVLAQQEFLEMYDNKNYPCARPTKPYNPVRSTEFYDILNDREIIINKLFFDQEDSTIKCDITLFDRSTNRITRGAGETEIKEGICYVKKAVSNTNPFRELTFSEEDLYGQGMELFRYRVDSDNNLNIIGNLTKMHLIPFDCSQYSEFKHGDQLAGTNQTYVSEDYQCVCVVGNTNNIRVKLNDKVIQQGYGANNVRYCILYLKPDDVISGTYSRIFKVIYKVGNPIPKETITYKYEPIAGSTSNKFQCVVNASSPLDMYYPSDFSNQRRIGSYLNNGGYTSEDGVILYVKASPQEGIGFYEDDNVDTYLGLDIEISPPETASYGLASVFLPCYGRIYTSYNGQIIESVDLPVTSGDEGKLKAHFEKQIPSGGNSSNSGIYIELKTVESKGYSPAQYLSIIWRKFETKVLKAIE